MQTTRRRTQAERRTKTIGRLVGATITLLAERGYCQLTVAAVCEHASLSQGALFRHFDSRNALIAAATEEVCHRHLRVLADSLGAIDTGSAPPVDTLLAAMRAATKTSEHAAWHEVMVAARTNPELHALVAPTLQRFEQSILERIEALGPTPDKAARLGTILLSVMHVFDSEAVTSAVYDNPPLVADRMLWLGELLRRELATCLTL